MANSTNPKSTSLIHADNNRFNGKLTKWNADRGFGFVVADHGEQELFVHVTSFPRDGRPPAIGELLTFEMELDKEGRKRAIRVRRPGAPEPRAERSQQNTDRVRQQTRTAGSGASSTSMATIVVALLVVGVLGWFGYTQFAQRSLATSVAPQGVMSPQQTAVPQITPPTFRCDGRKYCSQMTSCSEAKLFLKNCPGVEMDGNRDGIPCEQQWCTGPLGG